MSPMIRRPIETLCLCVAVGLLAGAAAAHETHDPEWEDTRAGSVPVETLPAEADEEWPDPYADERRWGPIQLGGGIGYHAPWQGRGGPLATANLLVSSPTGHWRFGGELFHREYETRFAGVSDVDIESWELNLVAHYIFFPGRITPYVGGGIGLLINEVDGSEVEAGDPTIDFEDERGAGLGAYAALGLEIPLTPHLALYSEGRIALGFQTIGEEEIDGFGDTEDEDLGGASAVIGMRWAF